MNDDYGLDWDAIAKYIGPEPLLTPSRGEEARLKLKEAFAEGRMVAGTTWLGRTEEGKRIGCAIGQAPEIGFYEVVATINNFTCLGLPVPDHCIRYGVPRGGGGGNCGKPLTTIDPLLRLIDLFVEGGR